MLANRFRGIKKPFKGRVICESAPEVTPHKPVGRVKVSEIFNLNGPNYHCDRINGYAYMDRSQDCFSHNQVKKKKYRVISKEHSHTMNFLATETRGRDTCSDEKKYVRLFVIDVNAYKKHTADSSL